MRALLYIKTVLRPARMWRNESSSAAFDLELSTSSPTTRWDDSTGSASSLPSPSRRYHPLSYPLLELKRERGKKITGETERELHLDGLQRLSLSVCNVCAGEEEFLPYGCFHVHVYVPIASFPPSLLVTLWLLMRSAFFWTGKC